MASTWTDLSKKSKNSKALGIDLRSTKISIQTFKILLKFREH